MSFFKINSETLDRIANAINAKTGKTAALTPAQMVTEIGSISGGSGGITPTGTIQISQNGTYNVTNYASADVNVSGGGGGGGSFTKLGEYTMAETWNSYNGLTSGTFGAIRVNIVNPQKNGLYYVRAKNNQDTSVYKFYDMLIYNNFGFSGQKVMGRRGNNGDEWIIAGFGTGSGNDGYSSANITSGTVLEIYLVESESVV